MDTILPQTPSTYWQLLQCSFVLYRRSFAKIFLLSLLLAITVFIPRFLSLIIGQDLFFNLPPLSPHRFWLCVINLVGLVFFIGILWHMHCIIRKRHEPLVEDLMTGLKKTLWVFIASIIQSLIVFAIVICIFGLEAMLHKYHMIVGINPLNIFLTSFVFLMQMVLIIYIFSLFFFVLPLIAIENKGILAAIERSSLLVWNHWWRVISLQFTPWIIYIIILFLVRYFLHIDIHIYFLENATHTWMGALFHVILFTLFIPWVGALLLVQLHDLELRKHLVSK